MLLLLVQLALAQNHAANLDGGDEYIDLVAIDPGDAFTVEAMVRFEQQDTHTVVCATDDNSLNAFCVQLRDDTWLVEINDADELEGDLCADSNPSICHVAAPSGYPADYHVAVTVDPTEMILYLNGVEAARSNTGAAVDWSNVDWAVGVDAEGGSWSNDHFVGLIDDVRIWDRVRSEDEIACTDDYALTGQEPGLIAYYDFDVDTNSVSVDATGNGYDGAWVNCNKTGSPFGLTESFGGDIGCFDFDDDGLTPDDGDCDDRDDQVGSCDTGMVMDTGDTGLDTGDTGFDTGDTGVDTGDTGFDTGDTGFDTGDTGFDTGDTGLHTGLVDTGVIDTDADTDTDSDSDTDTDADTDSDVDTDQVDDPDLSDFRGGGCTCAHGPSPAGGLALVLLPVWFSRRRAGNRRR